MGGPRRGLIGLSPTKGAVQQLGFLGAPLAGLAW